MGYTIYWYRDKKIEPSVFKQILADFDKIRSELDRNGILLAGPDGEGLPMINEYGLSFNGVCKYQGCCEAFSFVQELIFPYREPRRRNGKYFQYVKTEGLPYGLGVATFLIIAKHHLDDQIDVNSDKPFSVWEKASEWCQSILGYGADFLPENNVEE